MDPRQLSRKQQSTLLSVAALLVILVVGGLWWRQGRIADDPKADGGARKEFVERGITPQDMVVFLQRIEDIQKELEEAQAAGKRDISILLRLGNAYYTIGELGTAVARYNDILSTNPHDTPALENVGQAYLEMGDPSAALHAWERAILSQQNEYTYLRIAQVLDEHFPERRHEIQSLLEGAIQTLGQTPGLLVALGNWYRDQGRLEEAVSHYEVAVRLSGDKNIKATLEELQLEWQRQRAQEQQK